MARKRVVWACVFLLSALTLASASLFAQSSTTGLVAGVVTDPSGAVVPGATVTLEQHGTGVIQITHAGNDGRYAFPAVKPDDYTLTFAAKGFATTVVNELHVEVLKGYTVNAILKVGEASQTVTVTATAAAELQTTSATVGEVLGGAALENLPVYTRSASALMFYQPAVSPGGNIAGARSEQVTFTVDGGDATSDLEGNNAYASPPGEPSPSAAIPIPIESTQEFQVATSNPNSTFARSSGGQVALLSKAGTNQFHGELYEFHNDDGLNANGWTNDRLGIAKPASVDNRFGGVVGGPILKNKLFFFANYEGRRFHDATIFDAVVPTSTMKQGILSFPDAAGNVNAYSFAPGNVTTACGGNPCDPRDIGMSPVIQSELALYPTGNNPSLGDGLNTTGYTFDAPTPISENIGVLRLDYKISPKWSAFATYHYNNTQRVGAEQFSLLTSQSVATDPIQSNFITFDVTGQLSSSFTSVTHGSFLRNWWAWGRATPAPLVSGTDQALALAGDGNGTSNSTSKLIADPVGVFTSSARSRFSDDHKWYIGQDFSWIKGKNLFQFGGSGYIDNARFEKTDNYAGGVTSGPIGYVESVGNGSGEYLSVPGADRPATCAGGVTTGCLPSSDVLRYNELYAALLGLVDHSSQVITRNGDFQPNPIGTPLFANARIPDIYGYFQDIWRAKRSLTMTLGLDWGAQPNPVEAQGKYDNLVYADSNQPVDVVGYFQQRAASLNNGVLPGQAFNPLLGVTPVNHLPPPYSGNLRTTDWHAFGPRISVAWQLDPKTVLRGGYALVYERMDNIDEVSLALTTGGLIDASVCGGPAFSGGSAVCTNAPTNPADAFRVGVDGSNVPIPAPTAQAIPYVPSGTAANPFGLFEQDGLDPFAVPGHDHSIDFSIQRQLTPSMILEAGYIGRFSRNLFQEYSINAGDYLMKDKTSGQTYAQAFDGVAQALRNGTAVPDEPFFDNQIGLSTCQGLGYGNCSAMVATQDPTDLINGSLSFFSLDEFDLVTPTPVDNIQTFQSFMITDGGFSNYHAGFLTLKKSFTNGLQFQFNWTWSHAIGNQGVNQQSGDAANSPYNLNLDKSSEMFDQRHVITAWVYDQLPIGKGSLVNIQNPVLDKLVGGWYTSGIFTFATGTPMYISADGDYGEYTSGGTAAVCSANLLGSEGLHNGVTGSNGIGTAGDPARHGSGVNLFADPAAIYDSCSRPLLSVDSQIPFDELRAPSTWGVDYLLGKNITFAERYSLQFSAQMLNVFNVVQYRNPSLDLNSPTNFGVFTSQSNLPRRILLGLKLTF